MADRIVKYILAGDSKGAVKAFRETDTAAEKTGRTLDRTGKTSEASMARTEKGAKRLHGTIGGLAGIIGAGGLAFGIKDVVQAGIGWQSQQAQLQASLRATGQAAGSLEKVNKAVEASSTHGGFGVQEEDQGIAQLIRLTGSATNAVKLNAEAVRLARGAHLDYATAVGMVERIQTGQVGRLQKYLGIIQPVKTYEQQLTAAQKKGHPELVKRAQLLDKQATAAEANRRVMQRFGGSVSAFNRTAEGALSNSNNRFKLLSETIGRKLLPAVTTLAGWMSKHATLVLVLVGALVGLIVAVEAWTLAVKAAAIAQTVWNFAMSDNPIGLIIIAIAVLVAAVIYCYTHFKTFRQVVQAVWGWLKGAVVATVGWVAAHWKLLASILGGPFVALGIFVVTHFAQIKHAIGDVVGWIAGKFRWLIGIVLAPFKALTGAIHGLKHLGGGALHGVTGFLAHPFGLHAGGIVPAFSTGGVVRGAGSRDTVPAMLTPGEGVLRQTVMRALGAQNFNRLNNGDFGALLGSLRIESTTAPVLIDGRPVAELVVHHVAKMTARR